MQEIVGAVRAQRFDIELALEQQMGAQPLPFPGMDKSGAAICTFHLQSICNKGGACPFRHVKGDRSIVCKHWLRGLCKKGDDCEFLHEYDMSKMPECYFFSKFGLCSNKECPFLHIDPEKKMRDCPWYDRGFCRHGPNCKNRHVRRVMCQNYLCGFCLDGPECKYIHPKFDLPPVDPSLQAKKHNITCHYCGETGHKAVGCPKLPQGSKMDHITGMVPGTDTGQNENSNASSNTLKNLTTPTFSSQSQSSQSGSNQLSQHIGPRRPLGEVTCYKCGEKGHYANKCPKGHLAFLSNSAMNFTRQNQSPNSAPPS